MDAGLLKVNDKIERLDGEDLIVESMKLSPGTFPVYNFEVADFHTYFAGKVGAWVHNANCGVGKFATNADAADFAKELGFAKTNHRSHGQAVFKKGNVYISRDIDSHSGGAWKMAKRIEDLGNNEKRLGSYDRLLKTRIGD